MKTKYSTDTNPVALKATNYLFDGLASPQRFEKITETPFSMIDGALGDAYTASCMFHYTKNELWWDLFIERVALLVKALQTYRFDYEGLLGGLSGLAYVLQISRRNDDEFSNAIASLQNRIITLAERRLWNLHNDIGTKRDDYDFSLGLAGTAYYLFTAGGEGLPLAKRICDEFATRTVSSFPASFWTCSQDIDKTMVENFPELSAGMRDLGFAHGLGSVIFTLKQGYRVFNNENYIQAAKTLCTVFVDDIHMHNREGISYYQTPSPLKGVDTNSQIARQAWCYGTPSLEIAVSGEQILEEKIYSSLTYDQSYFDPKTGDFDEMGVCHGVAGRQYIANRLSLKTGAGWKDTIDSHISDFIDKDLADADLSFWHGAGGTLAVHNAHVFDCDYAPALTILGI